MRSAWRRRSALLTLLLHFLVAGLGPVADAHLEAQRDEVQVPLHVESEDAACAPVGHHHDRCLVCRTLEAFDAPSEGGARLSIALASYHIIPASSPRAPRAGAPAPPLGPRAPPAA